MKKKNNSLFNKKIKRIKTFIYICLFIIIGYFCYITIYKGEYYTNLLDNILNTSYFYKSAPRGRIYDRNNNLLVDNKMVPVIYYLKPNKITSLEEIEVASILANLLEIDYSKLTIRNLKDYYLTLYNCDDLITNEEWNNLKNRKLSDKDIYNLKLDRID